MQKERAHGVVTGVGLGRTGLSRERGEATLRRQSRDPPKRRTISPESSTRREGPEGANAVSPTKAALGRVVMVEFSRRATFAAPASQWTRGKGHVARSVDYNSMGVGGGVSYNRL